jgi:hypothetical protein
MYVGRFIRNEGVKGDPLILSDLIFQRISEADYEAALQASYLSHQ